MKTLRPAYVILIFLVVGTALTAPLLAEDDPTSVKAGPTPATQPSEAKMMAKMMELAKPGEPHRLLAQLVGTWDYKVKFSMTPGAALSDAGQGTAVRTALMDGRYFTMDVTGKMQMPGPDGQMKETDFKGMSLDGYDNAKQKFVSSWIDNMGTSILPSEGTYDAATKSFTYLFEIEMAPGKKTTARQVLQVLDADHLQMDWYESRGGNEAKAMEIDYARRK